MDTTKFIPGLKEKTEDSRDLAVGALYTLPSLDEIPEEFTVGKPVVKDQGISDFCAAFSSCSLSELQENVELCPEWAFAVGKMIEGDPESFGLELRTICRVHQGYGCIEAKDAPFSLETHDPDFLRRIENWPGDLFDKAIYHKKQSFFSVTGPYDHFDNIRASCYKFKTGALLGVLWGWSWDADIIDTFSTTGSGHAIAQIGFTKDMLYIQNSGGRSVGKNGRHYFSRDVINKSVERYGAFMFLDISKEKAREYALYGRKADEKNNALLNVLQNLLYLYKQLIKRL